MSERLDFEGYGGVRLAADAFGSPDGPVVLLVPSGGRTREFWHGSARALAEAGRYAICVDLRGHGDSGHAGDGRYDLDAYAADLRATLAALPSRACVVAAGLGGLAAMLAVGEGAPHLVSGLALVDVNIRFDAADVAARREAMLRRIENAGDVAGLGAAVVAEHPAEPVPVSTDHLAAAYRADADGRLSWRGDPRAFEGIDLAAEQGRLETAVDRIAAPVTLIRGSLNDTISDEATRAIQARIRDSEIADIEGAGHYLAADCEDAFNAILLDFLERHAPLHPVRLLGGSEPRRLRDALGCFATGVTVVTTMDGEGRPIGLTANSFTSVSLDPPLILFSLARSSANAAAFVDGGRFAVNVLHIGQQPVAGRFASRDIERFDGIDWRTHAEDGSPILAGALAAFDCRTHAIHDGGDHLILVGEVRHAWFEPRRDPLLYFRGRYRRLHFA